MSKRTSMAWIALSVLAVAVAVWVGGAWLWQMLLAMHGHH